MQALVHVDAQALQQHLAQSALAENESLRLENKALKDKIDQLKSIEQSKLEAIGKFN